MQDLARWLEAGPKAAFIRFTKSMLDLQKLQIPQYLLKGGWLYRSTTSGIWQCLIFAIP